MEKNEVNLYLRAQDAKYLELLITQYVRILSSNYTVAERLPVGVLVYRDEFLQRIDKERNFLMSFRNYLSEHSSYTPLACVCKLKCPFPRLSCFDCVFSRNKDKLDFFVYDSNIV